MVRFLSQSDEGALFNHVRRPCIIWRSTKKDVTKVTDRTPSPDLQLSPYRRRLDSTLETPLPYFD